MEITLWGVRGSVASSAQDTAFYGGNTACIELCSAAGTRVFFDAGTGLCEAGKALPKSGECHLFITHAHVDHIVGLWFFRPLHLANWTTHLYLPNWLDYLPDYLFAGGVFPVAFNALKGRIIRHRIHANEEILIGADKMRVTAMPTCHPDDCLGYRVDVDEARFFYSGDHEIKANEAAHAAAREMLRGADIAVVDATYERRDYKQGWGHSVWEDWAVAAQEAGVRNLVLTHHEVGKSDQELDRVAREARAHERPGGTKIYLARENLRFLPDGPVPGIRLESDWMLRFLDDLSQYKDENVTLDRILAMARAITNADAGTIFLIDNNELVFAYTHNDSLFSDSNAYKYAYATSRMPVSNDSIAGYVARTGKALNLDDVRQLPPRAPYRFNEDFDRRTGYRTHSMLTVPFFDLEGKVSGVLQIINRFIRGDSRQTEPFTSSMGYTVRLLAREAGSIIAHNALYRKNVYNILKMARVHDPSETGPHAERVGAVAAELYQRWAEKNDLPPEKIRYEKSRIRLAAMLHDIGKVGVSDLILKKMERLSEEEYRIMRSHTEMGASILAEETDSMSLLAHDIALHHHQKWNGEGYAGSSDAGRLSGQDIPLAARVTSIADVFDALISPRCYKEAWAFDDALALLREESGRHFDPELVVCMEEIRDMLPLIYQRFPDLMK
jgi:HD-GYP domain-containing protein (c-di-GMP phosphodiesterase class II)/phosphoribosyl 1,2-cyclic phosphodiesterase